jgi:hypothetical protein
MLLTVQLQRRVMNRKARGSRTALNGLNARIGSRPHPAVAVMPFDPSDVGGPGGRRGPSSALPPRQCRCDRLGPAVCPVPVTARRTQRADAALMVCSARRNGFDQSAWSCPPRTAPARSARSPRRTASPPPGGRELGLTESTLDALVRPATPPSGGLQDVILHLDSVFSLGYVKPFVSVSARRAGRPSARRAPVARSGSQTRRQASASRTR